MRLCDVYYYLTVYSSSSSRQCCDGHGTCKK